MNSWIKPARIATVALFSIALAAYVYLSWHWPLMHDMQVLHYVSFLIDKGWTPYREILDMNMPGAYLFERWALHLYGSSDLGWRFYDLTLSAVGIVAMVVIARPYDWLAGFVAGATFALVHGADGPMDAGQRDQLMAVLLLVAYALGFQAVRRRVPMLLGIAALCTGMAASVKPTLVFAGPVLFLLALLRLRREALKLTPYVLWILTGWFVSVGVVLWFLLSHGSLQAFIYDLTVIIPHYATIAGATWPEMLRTTLPRPLFVYIAFALASLFTYRAWSNWEHAALLCGIAFGLVNFYGQHKGFGQHRYTTNAFVILWATIQLMMALRQPGLARWIAATGLLYLTAVNTPNDVIWIRRYASVDQFTSYLEGDLRSIGPAKLQRSVQCLDLVDGCLTALYHLKIIQSNGSTGDLLLFLPQHYWVVENARATFLSDIQRRPPRVIVLSNAPFQGARTFGIVSAFPQMADILAQQYVLTTQRDFCEAAASHPGLDSNCPAYRIYQLKTVDRGR